MAILYSLVSRADKTILARHAACIGNFAEVTHQVLAQINPDPAKPRMSLNSDRYCFHILLSNNVIFLCITNEGFDRAVAFQYLETIKVKFEEMFEPNRVRNANEFALNAEFTDVMELEMCAHNKRPEKDDKVYRLREEVQNVKDIMIANIDTLIERGERLELLVDKTENLSNESVTFRQTTRSVRRQMWWENTRMKVILALIVIVIIYAIVTASCGGFTWPKCV